LDRRQETGRAEWTNPTRLPGRQPPHDARNPGPICRFDCCRAFFADNGKPVMTVKLYTFTCGTLTGEFAHLMDGGEGDITYKPTCPIMSLRRAEFRGCC
jgi:hypothetical protein